MEKIDIRLIVSSKTSDEDIPVFEPDVIRIIAELYEDYPDAQIESGILIMTDRVSKMSHRRQKKIIRQNLRDLIDDGTIDVDATIMTLHLRTK